MTISVLQDLKSAFPMNLGILALTALTTLIPLSKSTAACGGDCSGDEDNLGFHGKVTLPIDQNTYTATMTMYTVPVDGTDAYLTGGNREVSSSDTANEGGVMALSTGTGSMQIEPELPYQGKLNITGNVENTAVCLTVLSGTFEIKVPCDMVLETRYKVSEATAYSGWKAIETIKQEVSPAYGVYLDVTVDIQIRLHKKANDSGSGDGDASNGDGGDNGTSATPPTIPKDKQKEHPETGQPAEVTPASFKSSLPLGSTPESGGFNTGSLSLQGPIAPSLADLTKITVRDPDGNALKIFRGENGSRLQARNSTRLADVLPITGGFEVSIYEAGSFTPPSTEPGLSTPLTTATPSRKIRYEGIDGVAGIHDGGVKVTSTGPNGVDRVKEVVNLSGGGVRVTTDGGMQVGDTASAFYDENSGWHRADVTTVTRNGVLYSKTERIYLYQYREVGTSPAVMVENRLFLLEERVYYSNSNNTRLVTTWEPDPVFPGRVKSVARPDGSWEAYSYYSGEETGAYPSWVGLTKETLRPYNGTPSLANATSSNSELTVLTYDDIGDRLQGSTTYKPGTSVVIRKWARVGSSATLGTLVGLLEDAGLTTAWGNCCSYTYLRQDSSAEYASASEGIPSTSFTYVGSPVPGCPWVGNSFGSLDAEGNGYVTSYELGSYANDTFTPNNPTANPQPGSDVRSITVKVANYDAPVASEATREIVIRDSRGRPYLRELSIRNGSGWGVATTTTYEYEDWADGSTRGVTVKQDGRVVSERYAVSGDEIAATDEQGIATSTVRDALGRIVSVNRGGVAAVNGHAAQPDIVTNYEYRGHATTSKVFAGGLWRTEVTIDDLAGRTVSQRDASGAVTSTSYPNNGRDTHTVLPGGLIRIVTRNIDGRMVSIGGTAVIGESYGYSWDNSGNLVTTKIVGDPQTSPRHTITVQDWAGRTLSTTTPDPAGGNDVSTEMSYASNTRRMVSGTSPSGTKVFTKPSASSSKVYIGYKASGSGDLDPASDDRVTETGGYYSLEGGRWWEVSIRKAYDVGNSAASAVTSITKRCLYGVPADDVATETVSVSPTGEVTTVTTSIARASKTVTRTENSDCMTNSAVTVIVNGLAISRTGHGHTTPARWYYNPLGQPIMEVSPRGAVTRKSYDPVSGALSSVTDPAGNTTYYAYYGANTAAAGKLSQITNPAGGTTTYQYSALGQVTQEAGTAAYKVTYVYNGFGEKVEMRTFRDNNPAGDLTQWSYDPATGVLLNKTDAGNHTVYHTYYSAGRIHTRTWARNVTTTYSYNGFGDLTGIAYSDGTPGVAFSGHDRLGRPTSVTQAGMGSETLSYHAGSGALNTRYYNDVHTVLPGKGISYDSPDSAGRPSGFTETFNGGSAFRSVGYSYNAASGLMESVTDTIPPENGNSSTGYAYAYQADSSLVSTVLGSDNGTVRFRESRYYDIPGRLVVIRSDRMTGSAVTASISYHAYAYDRLGRRVKNTFQDGSYWTYGYNDRSEVTSATRKTSGSAEIVPLGATYTYDGIGNRLTSTSDVLGNHTYTPDSLNRYATITTGNSRTAIGRAPAEWTVQVAAGGGDAEDATRIGEIFHRPLTASNSDTPVWQDVVIKRDSGTPSMTNHFWYAKQSITPQYDSDGNLTNDGRWAYTCDAENRLIQMETTAAATGVGHPYVKVVYAYDWMGRMIARHVWKGGTAETPAFLSSSRWLCDGWNVIAGFSATSATSTTLTRTGTFTWGLDLSGTLQGAGGVGGLLAYANPGSSAPYYPSFDGNGNIVAWTRSDQNAPTSRREYDPFGNALVSEGTAPCSFGFSTKMQDAETGLYYYGHRWYDPLTGRWPSRDPIEEEGGVNLYGFLGNDGVNWVDLVGMKVFVIQRNLEFLTDDIKAKVNKLIANPAEHFGAIRDIQEVFNFYHGKTVHCILVVASECKPMEKDGKIVGFKGVTGNETWDFQSDSVIYHPAKDWSLGKFDHYQRTNVQMVVSDDSMDEKASNAANASFHAKDAGQYDIGGRGSNNCCDWVARILNGVGIKYSNPNPKPFGSAPSNGVQSEELIRKAVDLQNEASDLKNGVERQTRRIPGFGMDPLGPIPWGRYRW